MFFSEANRERQPVPHWVRFLIQMGYGWPQIEQRPRRIALISMPCDSAAAGLIALGVMIRDLTEIRANDIHGHADRLVSHARQFLQNCGPCPLDNCNPDIQQCGLLKKSSGIFRSAKPEYDRVRFLVRGLSGYPDCPVWLAADRSRGGGRFAPNIDEFKDFYVDGQSPIQLPSNGVGLDASPYVGLIPECNVVNANLLRSYSGVCLAGRVSGGAQTRAACESVCFRDGAREYILHELLSIRAWSGLGVSRVSFFNSLTGDLDRNAIWPSVVIADGDGAFLKVLAKPEFQECDVIGVIHRTIDRDKLEDVGNKMLHLNQWYSADEDMLCQLPQITLGISVAIKRRRT